MKKISLFGLIAVLAVGSLVWMGCEGAATPTVNNYYELPKVDGKPGLGDEDTLYLQYRPEIGYSVVTSLGTLQLELFAPSKSSNGNPVDAIVYAGTGETLDYEITVPDGKKLFIGYKISETATVGSLAIGENGSLKVGDSSVTSGSLSPAASLYVANGADTVTGSAVTLTKGGKIVANVDDATSGYGEVRGALGVQINGRTTEEWAIVSDTWADVNDRAADGGKVYYFGTENIGLTDDDYATVLETTGNVTVTGGASVFVDALKAASVTVSGGATLNGETLVSDVTLGTDAPTNGGLTGYEVTGNVVIVEGADGTLRSAGVSGNVTAWGELVTGGTGVSVGGYVAIDDGATLGAALFVDGSVYICNGAVDATTLSAPLGSLGTIYVNGGDIDFHGKFGTATDADIVLRAAPGASEESGYAGVAGATITPSSVANTAATIAVSVNQGGIAVGAGGNIGENLWLDPGTYGVAKGGTASVVFTGGTDAYVTLSFNNALALSIDDGGAIKAGNTLAAPVTAFGAGLYTAAADVTIDNTGLITLAGILTTDEDAKITTTLIDDVAFTPGTAVAPHGLTTAAESLGRVQGEGTVYVNNGAAISTTAASTTAANEKTNVGLLGTITGITLELPLGVYLATTGTSATLAGTGKIKVGEYITLAGTGTIISARDVTGVTSILPTGITVTGISGTASTITLGASVVLGSTGVTFGQAVFATGSAATTSITLIPSATNTVITTPAGGSVGAGASSTSFLLGASGTYTFTGGTVTAPATHGNPAVTSGTITEITGAGVTTVQQGASFLVGGPRTGSGATNVDGTLTVTGSFASSTGVITVTGKLTLPEAAAPFVAGSTSKVIAVTGTVDIADGLKGLTTDATGTSTTANDFKTAYDKLVADATSVAAAPASISVTGGAGATIAAANVTGPSVTNGTTFNAAGSELTVSSPALLGVNLATVTLSVNGTDVQLGATTTSSATGIGGPVPAAFTVKLQNDHLIHPGVQTVTVAVSTT